MALTAMTACPSQAGPRLAAQVQCARQGEGLVYVCTIELTDRQTHAPVTGATVVVGADMPAMPLAHNVPPVTAVDGGQPGRYRATLRLEMRGRWALRLEVSGPVKDHLVQVVELL